MTLNDIFPGWYNHQPPEGAAMLWFGGVFCTTTAVTPLDDVNFPWESGMSEAEKRAFAQSLDYSYHGVRSGSKFIANILYHGITTDYPTFNNGIPFYNSPEPLTAMLRAYYLQKWAHLWADYMMEYNALHSYSISDSESTTESETTTPDITDAQTIADTQNDSESQTRTPNLTEGFQVAGSETRTPNLTENETVTETRNTKDETTYGKSTGIQKSETDSASLSVYGFNSSDAVPKEATSDHKTTTQTTQDSGKDSVAGTGTVTTGKQASKGGTEGNIYTESSTRQTTGTDQITMIGNRQRSSTNTMHRTGTETVAGTRAIMRTRKGNIFKSPAELLNADREFWMTHYFEIIFEDIDKLLTLPIMSERDVNIKVF